MSVVIVGVDPGLVHTGVVRVGFDRTEKRISRQCLVLDGLDMERVARLAEYADLVFVEKYVPRSNYSQDPDMLKAEGELKRLLPRAVLLDNTGVHRIVLPRLMELVGLWDFPVSTHHQDLRSAARILLMGMLKQDDYNLLLSDIVLDSLDGKPWEIGDWR